LQSLDAAQTRAVIDSRSNSQQVQQGHA